MNDTRIPKLAIDCSRGKPNTTQDNDRYNAQKNWYEAKVTGRSDLMKGQKEKK